MYSLGYDVVVFDDNCKEIAKMLLSYGKELEKRYQNYISCLNRVSNAGLKSGAAAENFASFLGMVSGLKGQFKEVFTTTSNEVKQFVSDMDNVDCNIY